MRFSLVCVCFAACTQHVQLEPDPLGDLVSIELTPPSATITITDLSEPPRTLAYQAIGVFSDGSRRDITSDLGWSVDNPAPGGFAVAGTYTTTNEAAGHVVVTARNTAGVAATALLTVAIDAIVIDTAYPPPAPSLFDGATTVIADDPTHAPAYRYPADGTELPQGMASTLFQASRGAGNDELRLTFDADVLHLDVRTGADRWDTGSTYERVLEQSSVGTPIHVGITAAASAVPGTVYSGASIAMEFDAQTPGGLLTYWSSATDGIMLGTLAAESAPKLYPSDGTCVGCHAAARDGLDIAVGYGSETEPALETISTVTLLPGIDHDRGLAGGWATFSPDGAMVLVADDGKLVLRDATTGSAIGGSGGTVALPDGTYATHPDWSPDGSTVAIAYTQVPPTNLDVGSASIALLPYEGSGTFGPPQVIVAAGSGDNDYFPRFSPDGGYLAYVHATESSYGAASAELWLVPAGGGTPIALAAASHHVGATSELAGVADTMPTWAPAPGTHAFLAFASSRPYGAVNPDGGRPQIWISAIDLTAPIAGVDPSEPAFWLPCQDVTVLNMMPVWALDTTVTQIVE